MKTKKSTYGVAQTILYVICKAVWNLCNQYLDKFAAFKPIYTATYIADNLKAVQNAKNLVKTKSKVANRRTARVNLANATSSLMTDWQQLKIYITAAFDKSLVPSMLDAAGAGLYQKASFDNWGNVRDLIQMANTFMTENLDALTAKMNMPVDFPATFQANGENCNDLYTIFLDANTTKQQSAGDKIDASNAIYASTIAMMKDGQHIFAKDLVTKKLFTFSHQVSMNQGEGSASISGYVYGIGKKPLQGVTISIKDQKNTASTSKRGYFRITRMLEGTYTVVASSPGYTPVEQVITLAKGTRTTTSFELTNVMKKAA